MTRAHSDSQTPLRRDPRFVRFAWAKLVNLLGQNALIYGLFIILISQNKSALATGAFALTANIPSIVLGLPSGVAADRLPRKLTILATILMRIAIVWWFIAASPGAVATILATLAIWSIYQFYSPAESAALPAVASDERMGAANAWANAIALAAQVAGAGLIAPLAVKVFGGDGLFAIVMALFIISAWLFATISHLTVRTESAAPRQSILTALPQGWRAISDNAALWRIIMLTMVMDTAIFVLIVAAPTFIRDVLHTDAANAVYIAAPGAAGIVLGLLLAPVLLRLISPGRVVALGFILTVGMILTLPFLHDLSLRFEHDTPLRQLEAWLRVAPDIAAIALLLPLGGFGMTLAHIGSRTAIYHDAPEHCIAQVFATESAIGSIASVVPAIGAGLLIDQAGAPIVVLITGILAAGLALALIAGPLQHRPQPSPALNRA